MAAVEKKCPVCRVGRVHTAEERAAHHPLAGHGCQYEQGWCCDDARVASERERAEWAAEQERAALSRTA